MSKPGGPQPPRTLPWDWHAGVIPENVVIDETAYVETSFSFHVFRSRIDQAVRIGPGASTYLGTMFDVGPRGRVTLGRCALVHGARIICDQRVDIGNHALISWNVVIMDTYRAPLDSVALRRAELRRVAALALPDRRLDSAPAAASPVVIGDNVWIGFDACVLPGVSVGEGAIVGAKSVVTRDVPPYTVVAGNPAAVIRRLEVPPAEALRAARAGCEGGVRG